MTSDPEWEGFEEGDESIFTILTVDHAVFEYYGHSHHERGRDFEEGNANGFPEFQLYHQRRGRTTRWVLKIPVGKRLSVLG